MNTSESADRFATRWLLGIGLLFVVIWLALLAPRKLFNPDEGRYAEIPREMLVSGDWLTPRLNDLKYFEKPPLQYWATAIAYKIFGVNEFASRFWCGLTGLGAVLFTGWAGARLFGRDVGIVAVALLGCSLMQVVTAQLNTLDSGVSFFMMTSVLSFLLAQHASFGSRDERNWMLVAWIAAALGVLSKGLEAVALPGLAFVVYSLVEREFSAWKRLHVAIGLPIFLLLAAPWFIAVSIVNPDFAHFFFIHEHFERFLTDVHERVEPWWWFFVFLPVGSLPWIAMTVQSVRREWQLDATSNFKPRRFLLLWAIVILLFFSTSHSKLIPYILPAIPALALLTADGAIRMNANVLRRHLIVVAILWLIAAGYAVFGPLPDSHHASPELLRKIFNWGACAFAAMSIAAIIAWISAAKSNRIAPMIALGGGTFIGLAILLTGFGYAREVASGYDLAQSLKQHIAADRPLYSVNDYDQTLPFYLRRTMTLAGYRGELDFGLTQEPDKWLPDIAAFAKRWADDPEGSVAVMSRETYDALAAQDTPMIVIARDPHLLAVVKP